MTVVNDEQPRRVAPIRWNHKRDTYRGEYICERMDPAGQGDIVAHAPTGEELLPLIEALPDRGKGCFIMRVRGEDEPEWGGAGLEGW